MGGSGRGLGLLLPWVERRAALTQNGRIMR
jgi:hypothetical protein